MSEFARFEALLKRTMGLNPKSVGSAMIERAVRERCAARGGLDTHAYWLQVTDSPVELQELIERVIVPETWFFRDGEAFKTMSQLTLSHAASSQRPLRILSLPCSTGEEPYSMAMALLDAGVPPRSFRIDALDICTRSLATAQRAVYGMNSFRGKDLEFRSRHFVSVGDRYALAEAVRSKVRFRHGNLFDPALLADEHGYDFIFCRNALIYFGDDEQGRAVSVLDRLLNETGMLFVGPSESGVPTRGNLVSANIPLAFAFRKVAPAPAFRPNSVLPLWLTARPMLDAQATSSTTWAARPRATPARSAHDGARDNARDKARHKAWDKVSPAPRERDVAPAFAGASRAGSDDDPIAIAARLADQGRLREAVEICKIHVREHGPSAAAYYLLGLVNDAAGHHVEAREYYRKTLYLDPDHTEALVHLAALLEMRGDTAGAKRMNDRARRATPKHLNRHG